MLCQSSSSQSTVSLQPQLNYISWQLLLQFTRMQSWIISKIEREVYFECYTKEIVSHCKWYMFTSNITKNSSITDQLIRHGQTDQNTNVNIWCWNDENNKNDDTTSWMLVEDWLTDF